MGIRCLECQSENPEDTLFCGKCGTKFPLSEEIAAAHTRTLQTPVKYLIKGTTFAGRYEIIEELGRGGMGVVYKAQDTKLKRTVALKFLPPELTHISEVKDRFMREAQAAAALDHPHICTVYEFDEAEEKTFISMAYIEGQSLKRKIESGPFELYEALRIAIQVAEGLQEAHKKGVVHRDIKSANIMVTEKDQAKIMDFGLARITGTTLVTKEGTTMGTIAYMSPQQARGEEVDLRTDIWSLGVVLYEMFSGQLPFKGERDQAVIYSILNEQPKPITDLRSEIPMSIEQVVAKALEKNQDERYQNIEELLDDLRSISEGIEPEGIRVRLWKAKLLKRKRVIIYAGIAGFLIIMTVIVLSFFTGRAGAIDAIAVLPLENLTGDPGQEYFVDGVTDELIGQLAQIGALRVISRRSVMQYKGVKKPLPEIARELNVDAVVEGSVLRVAERVRITAQLIGAVPERHLWADNYDRDFGDILILSSEVARAIAREIKVAVTPTEEARLTSTRPVNPEAHDLYLRGKYHYFKLTKKELEKANEYFQQAIEVDPNYAQAYAGLAASYEYLSWASHLPLDEAKSKTSALLRKALEIDDTLAEAHLALSGVQFYLDWDWLEGEEEIKIAIALNQNLAEAHYEYAYYLMAMGRFEESIAEAKRALQLDPLSYQYEGTLAYMYYQARQYDQAIAGYQRMAELEPKKSGAYSGLARIYVQMGRYEDAVRTRQKAMTLSGTPPEEVEALGRAYSESGPKGYWMWRLEKLKGQYEHDPYFTAQIYAQLGDKEQAFAWLEKAYEKHDGRIYTLKVEPLLDPLRSDSRFQDLLRRLNFPE